MPLHADFTLAGEGGDRMRLTLNQILNGLRAAGVCCAGATAVALTGPFHYEDLGLPFPDFVAHGLVFYGLAAIMLATLPRSRTLELALALVAVGGASEVAQAMVGRQMSLTDFAGDMAGVAAAMAPVFLTRFRLLVREHPEKTFAEVRALDRRRGGRRGAVAASLAGLRPRD